MEKIKSYWNTTKEFLVKYDPEITVVTFVLLALNLVF